MGVSYSIEMYGDGPEIENINTKAQESPGIYIGIYGTVFVGETKREAKNKAITYFKDIRKAMSDSIMNVRDL